MVEGGRRRAKKKKKWGGTKFGFSNLQKEKNCLLWEYRRRMKASDLKGS